MTTLPRVLHETATRLGKRTALRSKELGLWRDISWDDYYERASRVALGLRALGLEKGDRVAVVGDNCAEWVQIDMGIQSAGGVTVGIYSTSPWQQCEYIVSHSGARFFFVENEEQLDKWLAFRDRTPALERSSSGTRKGSAISRTRWSSRWTLS